MGFTAVGHVTVSTALRISRLWANISFMGTEKYLRQIYLFDSFTEAMIKALGEKTSLLQCSMGQILIEQGKMNQSLWMLLKGSAKVFEVDGKRRAEVFTLKPGDIFGELSYADTLPASAAVEAHEDSVVLRVKFRDLDEVLSKQPLIKSMLLRKMIHIISQRLRKANELLRKQLNMGEIKTPENVETANSLKTMEMSFGNLRAVGHLPSDAKSISKSTPMASGKFFDGALDDFNENENTSLFDMEDFSIEIKPFSDD